MRTRLRPVFAARLSRPNTAKDTRLSSASTQASAGRAAKKAKGFRHSGCPWKERKKHSSASWAASRHARKTRSSIVSLRALRSKRNRASTAPGAPPGSASRPVITPEAGPVRCRRAKSAAARKAARLEISGTGSQAACRFITHTPLCAGRQTWAVSCRAP